MGSCRCNCGYTCGGPGRCEVFSKDMLACINNHFKKDCDHDFNSELKDMGDGDHSVVCTKCGMSEIGHNSRFGP